VRGAVNSFDQEAGLLFRLGDAFGEDLQSFIDF
jgi:hypothetical protein